MPASTVDVKRLEEVESLEPYSAVVIGAPMIFGWHREAKKIHQETRGFSQPPAGGLFHHGHEPDEDRRNQPGRHPPLGGSRGCQDRSKRQAVYPSRNVTPSLPIISAPFSRLRLKFRPVAVGFFGGKLAMYKMKWWQVLFVLIFIQTQQGGSHNMPFIREWAASLRDLFNQAA